MREKEVRGLMEAYSQVYTPQELTEEQVWEEVETWVNSLIEEGYDLSDYTWEEMYEAYIEELTGAQRNTKIDTELKASNAEVIRRGGIAGSIGRGLTSMFGNQKDIDRNKASDKFSDAKVRQAGAASVGKYYSSSDGKTYQNYNDAKAAKNSRDAKTATPKPAAPATTTAPKPTAPNPTARAATTAAKPATTAPKPATTAPKPTGSAMDQWAKANPKLAAAKAERDRTRGTSQSDNPLMKDMPGKRSMTPSVQSPTLAKDLGKGSGNQSLVNNPNASKAAPPKAAPTPTAAPKPAEPKKRETQLFHTDLFDLVKGHLLDEGYADSEEGAMVIMVNMSEGWKESILESCGVELVELTGGKGHPGYKAGSRDLGPMQSGHPADSFKRTMNGGTMSQRHGDHLGDLDDDDDDDDDEDGLEAGLKDTARKKRENVRKPLRDKVKAARKTITKEDLQAWVGQLIAEGYDLSEYTWEEVAEIYFEELELDESQHARENPEEYERSSEAKEGRRRRSGINDPKTGINSPAFQAFMAKQMGGKKKKD